MKIMVASDIHGVYPYAKQLEDAFDRENPDRLLLLGDLLYHGPRNGIPEGYDPVKVIEILNSDKIKNKVFAVRGNCDADVDQMVLDFPIMAEYCILYTGGRLIYATHGHIHGEDNPPKLNKGDILLHGHTHVVRCVEHENFVYMNPGSVSLPKEETHHGYMIITDEKITWKELDGTVKNEYIL